MRIAVDAMGGDKAPAVVVAGVVEAAKEAMSRSVSEILLVGEPSSIKRELSGAEVDGLPISIKEASQVIGYDESPATAVKTKPDSSIVVSTRLLKEGKAEAVVSAGSTGAVVASALMGVGRLRRVSRPAIATIIPTLKEPSILLDVGANVNCKPNYLLEFAVMGDCYARYVMGRKNPRVGILSIGEEASKGNELTFKSFKLLEQSGLNFIGNAEGRDIVNGEFDVVVCDGFTGNVVLKFGESLAEMILKQLWVELSRNWLLKLGAFLSKPAFKSFKRRVDYSEYGGAPLLGVNGVYIICHGGSSAKAIKNGIRVAAEFVNHQMNKHIEEQMAELYESKISR
ncbi:MAG: phosphate acyltransferase PlsX [bacterium]